jgi:serine/threonine protein kinase
MLRRVDVLFVIVEKGRDLNDLMIQKQQKLNLDSQAYKSAHRMVYIQMLVALWENQIFLGSTHHDVKPKNFVHMDLGQGETYEYFNEKGELVKTCATTTVKLIDFNNAVWRHAVSFPSHYGVTTGPYLPPECLFGFSDTPCFQGRDMFSLALVKMEFILGKHPYDFMRDKTLEPPEKFVECLLGKWKNEKKRDHMKRAILPLKRSEQEQYAFIAFACLILIMREGVMEFLAHEFELPDLIKTLVDTKSDEMRFDVALIDLFDDR